MEPNTQGDPSKGMRFWGIFIALAHTFSSITRKIGFHKTQVNLLTLLECTGLCYNKLDVPIPLHL